MLKRGQVTIFIILGIIVVAVLAWVFFIGDLSFGEQLTQEEAERFVSVRLESVRSYVEGCVESNSWTILKNMGRQGGRVIPEANYYDIPLVLTGSSLIDYSLIKKSGRYVNYNPSVKDMETDFENFMNGISSDPDYPDGVGKCLDDVKKQFKDSFSDIETGDFSVDAEFGDRIKLYVRYPITLKKSSYETVIDDYYIDIPINMREIHEVSNRVINSISNEGRYSYQNEVDDIYSEYNSEIANGLRDDFIFVSSSHYLIDNVGSFNNANNILFTLEYSHPELAQNYIFRFLVGTG